MKRLGFCLLTFVLGAATAAVLPARGAEDTPPAKENVAHVVVTLHTTAAQPAPVLSAEDIRVFENHHRLPVKTWVAAKAQSGPRDLTILMDDSVRANVSLQFRDLAAFFSTLPAGTRVRIAYAEYGGNKIVRNFTTDYPSAGKALRLPIGASMAGGSIFDSVSDLVKKWPHDGNPRALLLVSDGIDLTQGLLDTEPPLNPELQQAIDAAQKADVTVYTIFARGPLRLERDMFLMNNGQSCLLSLSTATGGQSYFQGTRTPLAYAPYLRQFARDLHNQYLLTFLTLPSAQSGYHRIRVTTEVPGVRLSAPARVFVPKTT